MRFFPGHVSLLLNSRLPAHVFQQHSVAKAPSFFFFLRAQGFKFFIGYPFCFQDGAEYFFEVGEFFDVAGCKVLGQFFFKFCVERVQVFFFG